MGTLGALFGVAYQSLRYRIGGVVLAIAAVAISARGGLGVGAAASPTALS